MLRDTSSPAYRRQAKEAVSYASEAYISLRPSGALQGGHMPREGVRLIVLTAIADPPSFCRRNTVLALIWLAATLPQHAYALAGAGIHRIGFLYSRARPDPFPDAYIAAFLAGMRELGYEEGKNLIIEWRFADGDYSTLPKHASDLAHMKVEVIVAMNLPGTLAAQKATSTIPIVFTSLVDPVDSGVASSLSRPDLNATGLSLMTTETAPKQVELLHQALPRLRTLAVLINPRTPIHPKFARAVESAAAEIGIKVETFEATNAAETESAMSSIAERQIQAVVVGSDSVLNGQRHRISDLGLRYRIATLLPSARDVEAGALFSYGPELLDYYRRGASYVDRILNGTSPRDLPIEQPLFFRLGINLRTARSLGIKVPDELRLRADQVVQ
jgi:putative ABC transport system substrate-binding protein